MKNKALITLLLLLVCGLAFADGTTVSLKDAIASANANNTDMEVARHELEIALRNANGYSAYIPNISLDGSIALSGSVAGKNLEASLSGNIGISLDLGSNLITNAAASAIARSIAYIEYASSRDSLEESVTASYLSLAQSKKEIASASKSLEISLESLAMIKEAYESGLASSLDLANAEYASLSAEYSLKALKDTFEIAKESFRIITGIEGDFDVEDMRAEERLTLPGAEELFNEYSESVNEIQNLNALLRQSETTSLTTKLNYMIPTVTLSAGWDYGNPNSSYLLKRWNISGSQDSEWSFSDSAYVSLGFSIPISSYIPGSEGSNAVKNSDEEIAIAKVRLKRGLDDLKSTIKTNLINIEQGKENVTLLSRQLEMAELTYSLALDAYQAGLLTTTDLLSYEEELSNASLALISAESSYLEALYNLCFTLDIDYDTLISLYGENS